MVTPIIDYSLRFMMAVISYLMQDLLLTLENPTETDGEPGRGFLSKTVGGRDAGIERQEWQ
ncbi:MAG: hypothetical protein DHS20C10_14000 [marine bacterium B5-7]|nr:MAG: hypothetical protein NMNS01_28090 [Nitrosomonas sp.]GJM07666.1 MAG: hypothetical protein DHS20C10_14000 [marine bacterium B5-7]